MSLSALSTNWRLEFASEEEKAFAESPFSHVDFLIYNSLTKQPLQTIEVDGWHFHQKAMYRNHEISSKINYSQSLVFVHIVFLPQIR